MDVLSSDIWGDFVKVSIMRFLCELLERFYICKGILVHDVIGLEFSNMKGFISTIMNTFMLLTRIFLDHILLYLMNKKLLIKRMMYTIS